MTDKKIKDIYDIISAHHSKYLKDKGVVLPNLKHANGGFTKDALILVYLCQDYPDTHIVTKQELTSFIRTFYQNTNDVQQARHLAAQDGWFILSGGRKDNNSIGLKRGEYILKTLKDCYPGFTKTRREESADFEEIKRAYDFRCATCGSKEGEPHRYWKSTTTILQKGHMDPSKPLDAGNIIPQCEKCNRPDRNYWIYDKKGRVVGIANEKVIDKCSKEIQRKIYERLKLIFE